MRRTWLLSALVLVLLLGTSAPAEEFDEYVDGQIQRPSEEAKGQACWPYLRSPLRVPNDPVCQRCESGKSCGLLKRPRGHKASVWDDQGEEAFWKRHCWSWGIRCSQCWAEEAAPECDELIGGRQAKVLKELQDQIDLEGGTKRNPMWLAVSPHFYVITDMHRQLKVPTEGGAPRIASGHEVAHLYAQRCELAYRDFVHYFGSEPILGMPMGVYLFTKNRDMENAADRYLGSRNSDMLYGGGHGRIAGGYCGNGFVASLAEQRSDTNLHALCRHFIGHILFSCWLKVSPDEKTCPKWAFIGTAHFLEKLLKHQEDYATFCSNETSAPQGSGKDWYKKSRSLVHGKLDPIETFFGRESMGAFKYKDHIRAWSYMDLMLKEDRDRWLAVLEVIRDGAEEGAAFREGLGITPDAFNERWKDRLTGKRATMGEVRADARSDEDEPGSRDRRRILETVEPTVLAGLIRGLDRINDLKTAKVVIDRLDHMSDLVRETIHVVLLNTTDPKVLEYLRTVALEHTAPFVRAHVARVLGVLKQQEARSNLEFLLEDRHWLVRAEAAWALGELGNVESLPLLIRGLEERSPKAWIVFADAVASFGRPDKGATLKIVPHLSSRHWQVRVTAAQALTRIGTEEAMGPLIERFNREDGRLYRELRRALKAVSQDDLGPNPETWRKWWEKQQAEHGGLGPMPEKRPEPDARYGDQGPPGEDDPSYYGRRIFSKAVGFVLDTSGSMDKTIHVAKDSPEGLDDVEDVSCRYDLAVGVLKSALEKLDPRVKFSLVLFASLVNPWKNRLMPATPANIKSAVNAAKAADPRAKKAARKAGDKNLETNIHGALRAALGLHEKESLEAQLDPIPDTVYFLTDGSPTRGEITDSDALLAWFEFLNRYAKVELHVIAMGNLGVDIPFLKRLAEAGGGDFIHVRED